MRPLATLAMLAVAGCADVPRIDIVLPSATTRPAPGQSHLEQAQIMLRRGDYAGADRAFRRSIAVEGVSAIALSGLGVAAEKRGLLGEARQFFEMAAAQAPTSPIAQNNLGAIHFRLGNYEAARRAFQTAFALSSGRNTVAAHNLGLTDQVIAERDAADGEALDHPHLLQRLGSGEYRLTTDPDAATKG